VINKRREENRNGLRQLLCNTLYNEQQQ